MLKNILGRQTIKKWPIGNAYDIGAHLNLVNFTHFLKGSAIILEQKFRVDVNNYGMKNLSKARRSFASARLLSKKSRYQFAIGQPQNIEAALRQLGLICIDLGYYKEGHNYLEESLQFAIGVGHKGEIAITKGALGRLAKAEGNISEAIR